jgi:hypothetical protein
LRATAAAAEGARRHAAASASPTAAERWAGNGAAATTAAERWAGNGAATTATTATDNGTVLGKALARHDQRQRKRNRCGRTQNFKIDHCWLHLRDISQPI